MLRSTESESLEDTDTQTWHIFTDKNTAMSHRPTLLRHNQYFKAECLSWSQWEFMSVWRENRERDWKEKRHKVAQTHLSPGCGSRTLWLCSLQRQTQTERSPSSQLALGHQPENWRGTWQHWFKKLVVLVTVQTEGNTTSDIWSSSFFCSTRLDGYTQTHKPQSNTAPCSSHLFASFTLSPLLLSRTLWMLCPLYCCRGNQGKHVAVDAVPEHFLSSVSYGNAY